VHLLLAASERDTAADPNQACAADDVATQVYDDAMPRDAVLGRNDAMTQEYDLEPVTSSEKLGDSKPQSQDLPTQVMGEVDRSAGRDGRNCGSAESASQSSTTAPTQVFDVYNQGRSASQPDDIATQTLFDAGNSRQSNSQSDFLATQVFDAVSSMTHKNTGNSPSPSSRPRNSQPEPATQVFDAVPTMRKKSDGSPGFSSPHTDVLATQVFCQPTAVAPARRTSGGSPHQAPQTFSTTNPPARTSDVSKDGTRASFSPHSCSTQVFPCSEAGFPNLALEMSECNDSHDDSAGVTPTAARVSLLQVSYLYS